MNADAGGSQDHCEERKQLVADFATLPEPSCVSSLAFLWGDRSGDESLSLLEAIYAEVVHWRGNVFTVPLAASGKRFVVETTRLADAFADGGALDSIAILAMMVMLSIAAGSVSFFKSSGSC